MIDTASIVRNNWNIHSEEAFAASLTIPTSLGVAWIVHIAAEAFDSCTDLLIYGTKGSPTEDFALEHGFPFVLP